MKKGNLLLIPFLVGLLLIVCSWYLSFPLSHHYANDSIFNHISILYWIGFSLSLTSTYLIAISFKNGYLKWIMAVAFVLTFYSLSYFFNTLSTSDSSWFRGLTENFIRTHDLTAGFNEYYQWPAFFILADVTSAVSGLGLITYEFLLISIIGFLLSTALYVYFSHSGNCNGFLAVSAFFTLSFVFLNYQAVPFTIAFCLLFLLFDLEVEKWSASVVITTLILFMGITLLHFTVPLFFLTYLLIRLIITRNKKVFTFFIMLLQIYILEQFVFGGYGFAIHIKQVFTIESDYSRIVATTVAPVATQVDIIAQSFSRIVIISFGLLCLACFVFVLLKKKLRNIDKAILLTGSAYSGIGVVLYVLGTRAIPLILAPISIGLLYVYKTKFRSFLKYLLILMFVLTVFLPMHNQYSGYPITYQTKENLITAKFLIDNYNWSSNPLMIVDNAQSMYIYPQVQVYTIDTNYNARFGLANITQYDCIIYSVGLETSLRANNISINATSRRISNEYSIAYDSAFSYIATKTK